MTDNQNAVVIIFAYSGAGREKRFIMNYVSFFKARYKENNIAEKYMQVFSASETIHLDFKIHDNPAFIVPCGEVYNIK